MNKLIILLALTAICSCTIATPRNIPHDYAGHCETVDCVVNEVDRLADKQEYGGNRYAHMEGYEDTYLRKMLEDGRLTISAINPLYIPLGVYGYAIINPGKYGEHYKCDIKYLPIGWHFLVHELLHCQGYTDVGFMDPFSWQNKYTEEQQAIINQEKKERWVDTSFYKQRKYVTPDFIPNKY